MHLPKPQPRSEGYSSPGGYRVALVCLGNICRSPIASVVLQSQLTEAGFADRVTVTSAGIGDWHIGETMDRQAAKVLTEHGYDASRHRARLFDETWFEMNDVVLGMDPANVADVQQMAGPGHDPSRVMLFRSFDPGASVGDVSVPDPWGGGPDGFELVLSLVERTTGGLVDELRAIDLEPA